MFGTEPRQKFCNLTSDGTAAIVYLACDHKLADYGLAWPHFVAVREQLAPRGSLPLTPGGERSRGPTWLTVALGPYVQYRYQEAAGHDDYASFRNTELNRAMRITRPLSSMATNDGFFGDEYWEARAVGFLAVEWLSQRGDQPALFEYYRLLPDSENWEEAFEGAFGLTVDEFYEAFEEYRAKVAPSNLGAH